MLHCSRLDPQPWQPWQPWSSHLEALQSRKSSKLPLGTLAKDYAQTLSKLGIQLIVLEPWFALELFVVAMHCNTFDSLIQVLHKTCELDSGPRLKGSLWMGGLFVVQTWQRTGLRMKLRDMCVVLAPTILPNMKMYL